MSETWTVVPGYRSAEYTDPMIFKFDLETKKIEKITKQVLVSGEKNSQYICFVTDRYFDGIDLVGKRIQIVYLGYTGRSDINEVVNVECTDKNIRFGWVVPGNACYDPGTMCFSLEFVGEDYVLKSRKYDLEVTEGLNGGSVIPEPTDRVWYIQIQSQMSEALEKANTILDGDFIRATDPETETPIHMPEIADSGTSTTDTWSSSKINSELTAKQPSVIEDSDNDFNTDTVEGALHELAVEIASHTHPENVYTAGKGINISQNVISLKDRAVIHRTVTLEEDSKTVIVKFGKKIQKLYIMLKTAAYTSAEGMYVRMIDDEGNILGKMWTNKVTNTSATVYSRGVIEVDDYGLAEMWFTGSSSDKNAYVPLSGIANLLAINKDDFTGVEFQLSNLSNAATFAAGTEFELYAILQEGELA